MLLLSGADLGAPMQLCQRAGQKNFRCAIWDLCSCLAARMAYTLLCWASFMLQVAGARRSNALYFIEVACAGVPSRAIQCGDRQDRGDGARGVEGLPSQASTAAQRCESRQRLLQVSPIGVSPSVHAPSGQLFEIANLGTCL